MSNIAMVGGNNGSASISVNRNEGYRPIHHHTSNIQQQINQQGPSSSFHVQLRLNSSLIIPPSSTVQHSTQIANTAAYLAQADADNGSVASDRHAINEHVSKPAALSEPYKNSQNSSSPPPFIEPNVVIGPTIDVFNIFKPAFTVPNHAAMASRSNNIAVSYHEEQHSRQQDGNNNNSNLLKYNLAASSTAASHSIPQSHSIPPLVIPQQPALTRMQSAQHMSSPSIPKSSQYALPGHYDNNNGTLIPLQPPSQNMALNKPMTPNSSNNQQSPTTPLSNTPVMSQRNYQQPMVGHVQKSNPIHPQAQIQAIQPQQLIPAVSQSTQFSDGRLQLAELQDRGAAIDNNSLQKSRKKTNKRRQAKRGM